MKTLKELHDEEQREARLAQIHHEFTKTMQGIDADYQASMKKHRRNHELFTWAIMIAFILTMVALAAPAVIQLWRML